MIEVRPVADRRGRRRFIDLPYQKYRGHPHWIPPARLTEAPQFDPKRNPFYSGADMDLFLAWDFTVASERNLSERMLSIRDQSLAALGDGA